MLTNFNYPKMRCKKMHWMTENTIWQWWCTFTDCNSQLLPRYAVGKPEFKFMQTNFGNNQNEQCQQGPPMGATTNA